MLGIVRLAKMAKELKKENKTVVTWKAGYQWFSTHDLPKYIWTKKIGKLVFGFYIVK